MLTQNIVASVQSQSISNNMLQQTYNESAFLPTLLKQKNDLASIFNNNILLCYTPVQIRLSLEKILSKYSLLEVTGSNGYKMLYKIANKKF